MQALVAEGVGCEVGYPSLSRDPLFQPALSRLPVPMQYPELLDVAEMHFPVADRVGSLGVGLPRRERLPRGPGRAEDAVEVIAKVQRLLPDARQAIPCPGPGRFPMPRLGPG